MAAMLLDVPFSAVSLSAATLKTVVGVKAAANVNLKVLEAACSFNGADSTAVPVLVGTGVSNTFATNSPGTNSTSITPIKRDQHYTETFQGTAAHTWTAEPTVKTNARALYVAAYNGLYHNIYPFSSPFICKGGNGFSVEMTAPATVLTSGHLTCEE